MIEFSHVSKLFGAQKAVNDHTRLMNSDLCLLL